MNKNARERERERERERIRNVEAEVKKIEDFFADLEIRDPLVSRGLTRRDYEESVTFLQPSKAAELFCP